MVNTFIILRYADGAIVLTGWGTVWILALASWTGIFTNFGGGRSRRSK